MINYMKRVQNFLKKQKFNENVLAALLLIFIVFPVGVPDVVSPFIASIPGTIVVILLMACLFSLTNPVIGILGLIAAYELIRRSGGSLSADLPSLPVLQSSEEKKTQYFKSVTAFPKTLEETVIEQMVPLVRSAGPPGMAAPKPKLESDNNASPV